MQEERFLQFNKIQSTLQSDTTLVAVSKTHSVETIQEIYGFGQRDFGENKVQELTEKFEVLPKDIRWHLIGHLQTNKVKLVIPIVYLIHSVDSEKLLERINLEAGKISKKVNVLLQIKIASEETKFGLTTNDGLHILDKYSLGNYPNVTIQGLMGMASFVDDKRMISSEFKILESFYNSIRNEFNFSVLSMGMSDDYLIAIENGSNMVRVGSKIFGSRNYIK